MREYRVAVFPMEGRRQYIAYVRDYNPEWSGCCLHTIPYAPSGEQAKRWAIAEHRAVCVSEVLASDAGATGIHPKGGR